MYRIEDDSVTFQNGRRVKFDDFIAESVPFEDTLILRFENQGWKKTNENVLAVDYAGNIQWRIRAREYTYSECPYVQIVRRDDKLEACGWDGRVLSLDPRFGTLLKENWVGVGAGPASYIPSARQYT